MAFESKFYFIILFIAKSAGLFVFAKKLAKLRKQYHDENMKLYQNHLFLNGPLALGMKFAPIEKV